MLILRFVSKAINMNNLLKQGEASWQLTDNYLLKYKSDRNRWYDLFARLQ